MSAPAVTLVFTTAGLERFTAAQLDDDVDLTVTEVGLTDQVFVAAPTLTALPGEFRRVGTLSGDQVGDNIVHLLVRDEAAVTYTVRGFGLYLADGTLFGVYGQADPIFQKSIQSTGLLAIDIAFPTADINALSFGDTDFLDPPATTERKGVVELATDAEAAAGTDTVRAVTPKALDFVLDALRALIDADIDTLAAALGGDIDALQAALTALLARTITGTGLVTGGGDLTASRTLGVAIASSAEILAGTENGKAVTPAGLAGVTKSLAANGYVFLPGGLVVQWGGFTAAGDSTTGVTFPIAFPVLCAAAVVDGGLTGLDEANDEDNSPELVRSTVTTSGFSAVNYRGASVSSNFIAVGY